MAFSEFCKTWKEFTVNYTQNVLSFPFKATFILAKSFSKMTLFYTHAFLGMKQWLSRNFAKPGRK